MQILCKYYGNKVHYGNKILCECYVIMSKSKIKSLIQISLRSTVHNDI